MKDDVGRVVSWAAWALGKTGPQSKDAVPALTDLLDHRDSSVRGSAAVALTLIGSVPEDVLPVVSDVLKTDGIPPLLQALQGDKLQPGSEWYRASAATDLGQIGPVTPKVVPGLIGALGDRDAHVRSVAAKALGQIGPQADVAIPALMKALEDKDKDVREAAETALRAIQENP